MTLTLSQEEKIEVRSFKDASKQYLFYCERSDVFCEESGELHGGPKNFLVGRVDKQGNIWNGQLWPNSKKIFDNQKQSKKLW
jgi:hypothetical protein